MARKRRRERGHGKHEDMAVTEETVASSGAEDAGDGGASKPEGKGPRHLVVNIKASSGTVEIVSDSSEDVDERSGSDSEAEPVSEPVDDSGGEAAEDAVDAIDETSSASGFEGEHDGSDSVPDAAGDESDGVVDAVVSGDGDGSAFEGVTSSDDVLGPSEGDTDPCVDDSASVSDDEASVSEVGSGGVFEASSDDGSDLGPVDVVADAAEASDVLCDVDEEVASECDAAVVDDMAVDEGADVGSELVDDADALAVGDAEDVFDDDGRSHGLHFAEEPLVDGDSDVDGDEASSDLEDAVDAIMETMESVKASVDDGGDDVVAEADPGSEEVVEEAAEQVVVDTSADSSSNVTASALASDVVAAAVGSDSPDGTVPPADGSVSDSEPTSGIVSEADDKSEGVKVGRVSKVVSAKVCAVVAAGMLGVGLLVGGAVAGGASSVNSVSVVSVDKGSLGDSICRVSWRGHSEDLTVEDVLLANGSALSSGGADSYEIPSTETIVAVARSRVLAMAAAEEGISVSDEDVKNYVVETLNVPDFKTAIDTYGMTEDELIRLARNSVITDRLREHVLEKNGVTSSEPPVAPTPPAEDAEGKPSKEYYDYIVGLVGDDGVSESGEITNEEYASALKGLTVNAQDGATFEAAQLAYDVALKSYASELPSDDAWSEYRKDILKDGAIEVRTLTW